MTTESILTILGVGVAVFVFAMSIGTYMYFFRLWFKGHLAGTPIGVFALLRMPLKRIHPVRMVNYYIEATKAELGISLNELESVYLKNGNVERALQAVLEAKEAGQTLSLAEASERYIQEESSIENLQSNSQAYAARQQGEAQRGLGN